MPEWPVTITLSRRFGDSKPSESKAVMYSWRNRRTFSFKSSHDMFSSLSCATGTYSCWPRAFCTTSWRSLPHITPYRSHTACTTSNAMPVGRSQRLRPCADNSDPPLRPEVLGSCSSVRTNLGGLPRSDSSSPLRLPMAIAIWHRKAQ